MAVAFQPMLRFYRLSPLWGIAPTLLKAVHLGFLFHPWLGREESALFTLGLISVWQWLGVPLLLSYAALIAIPGELLEAAEIDGIVGQIQHLREEKAASAEKDRRQKTPDAPPPVRRPIRLAPRDEELPILKEQFEAKKKSIADLEPDMAESLDRKLRLKGRIVADGWIAAAKKLVESEAA